MRKKKLILSFILFTITLLSARTQNVISTFSVDTKTYNLYKQKEWKKLIELGQESLDNGIDFYYLQYRMGVAYYELKNYRKAIHYFKRITAETPEDKVAIEYLYYSYLFSGMYEDARLLGRSLPADLKKKLNIKPDSLLVNSAGAEYKYYIINNFEVEVSEGDVLSQKILRNLWYADFNLTSYSKGNLTIFQGFSYLNGKNKVFNSEYSSVSFDESIRQFQYYISGNVHMTEGTDLKAAFHYVNTKLEATNPDATQNPGHGQGSNDSKYFYTDKEAGFAGFLKYNKSISDFDLKATVTISNFDRLVSTQFLPGIGIKWYPFGNTNLYVNGEVTYIFAGDVPDYNPGFIYKSNIGVRLLKRLWAEPFMLYGEAKDFVDEDAFVVYNSHNTINYSYGLNLNTSLLKDKVFIYFSWQQYSLTNQYYLNIDKKFIDFNISTFLGGFKYRF